MKNTIGPYNLVAKLGEGGMAEVFKAIKKTWGQAEKPVAIKKILPPYHDRPDIVSMFKTEAEIHAELSHPKLVNLINYFEEKKNLVLVLEYVRGKNLHQVLFDAKRHHHALPWPLAVHIATEVLEVLEYAHTKSGKRGPLRIVHRDISPQNILISFDGTIKLSDFGIAMADIERDKTASGALKGKVRYLSPEQIKRKDLDQRSDIFSLGIVLYELICSRHPFEAKVDFEIMDLITQDIYHPPHALAPHVPKGILDALIKSLANDPKSRFKSAGEMRSVLLEFQDKTWRENPQKLMQTWLSRIYSENTMHNENPLSQTVVLLPKKKSSLILTLLTLSLLTLGALFFISTDPSPEAPAKLSPPSGLPTLPTQFKFEAEEGSSVFINGKKIGIAPLSSTYKVEPGDYVILMISKTQKKSVSKVSIKPNQTLVIKESK